MARYGLQDRVLVAANGNGRGKPSANGAYFGMAESEVPDLLAEVDLLLNFNYHLGQDVVSAVRRSALVDIDPGLLQFWISSGLISPAVHDSYFTIGETVGRRPSPIPDCGIDWMPIRPPVCLDLWPSTYDAGAEVFTTVSSWWGKSDYVGTRENFYDNTKRKAFLDFIDLPHHTDQPLEVALFFAEADARDRRKLEDNGWRVRHSQEIAASPESYRAYIQASRGEFSLAKPSCGKFQNAWVSDRSLCYLASGKPVVVQHTGPSDFLPDSEGMFRFKTLEDAAQAIEAINGDYQRQCRSARSLAEEYFDAEQILTGMLGRAL
jgi:hypothetical protein